MKLSSFTIGAISLLSFTLKGLAESKPNIVYILADDLGYGDLGCYNAQGKIATPNLDKLAKSGIRFTDAHSPTSVCSPTRYAVLTGRYAWRGPLQRGVVAPWGAPILAPDRLTIAELLKENGYSTACIGKWHLGLNWPTKDGNPARSGPDRLSNVDFTKPIGGGPTTHGFDYYFGTDVPNYPPYCFIENDRTVGIPTVPNSNVINRPGPSLPDWKFVDILPELTNHAVDFIKTSAKATPAKPFFLYFPLTGPHYPVVPTKEFQGKSGAGNYGDFVEQIDDTVGQVLSAIEAAGVAKNTIVIFTSDNGPEITGEVKIGAYDRLQKYGHSSVGELRGAKRDTWEGGHRVPFIVSWPGKIPEDVVNESPISLADFFATAAAAAGAKYPANAGVDSVNLLPTLLGEGFPAHSALIHNSGWGRFAVREGSWVLIDSPSGDSNGKQGEPDWLKAERGYQPNTFPGELYDLKQDISQRRNLYGQQPEKVRELKALLDKSIADGRTTPGPKQVNDVEVVRISGNPSNE